MLNVVDEFTRECLAIGIDRKLNSTAVIDALTDLFILQGVPGHVRSDNRAGVHRQGRSGLDRRGRSENGIHRARQSLGKRLLREFQFEATPLSADCSAIACRATDELLNGEIFYSLAEARVVIEAWRVHYNTARPHSLLGYRPPAPEAIHWPSRNGGSSSPQATAMAPSPVMH